MYKMIAWVCARSLLWESLQGDWASGLCCLTGWNYKCVMPVLVTYYVILHWRGETISMVLIYRTSDLYL